MITVVFVGTGLLLLSQSRQARKGKGKKWKKMRLESVLSTLRFIFIVKQDQGYWKQFMRSFWRTNCVNKVLRLYGRSLSLLNTVDPGLKKVFALNPSTSWRAWRLCERLFLANSTHKYF